MTTDATEPVPPATPRGMAELAGELADRAGELRELLLTDPDLEPELLEDLADCLRDMKLCMEDAELAVADHAPVVVTPGERRPTPKKKKKPRRA